MPEANMTPEQKERKVEAFKRGYCYLRSPLIWTSVDIADPRSLSHAVSRSHRLNHQGLPGRTLEHQVPVRAAETGREDAEGRRQSASCRTPQLDRRPSQGGSREYVYQIVIETRL